MFKIVLKTMLKTAFNPALKTLPILLLCVVNLTLVSCGTKGPLYIPEQRYPQGVPKEQVVPKDQGVPKNQSVPKDADKAVENDATKNAAPAANTDAPSSSAP